MTTSAIAPASPAVRRLTVALIGNPNTGKSTLFNALAGMRAHVGNYPGVTVEKKLGTVRMPGCELRLVDLPGTYSLSPRSRDEMVAVDVLLGRQPDVGRPDAVVCIADAANLERHLYLFSQIRELGLPTVLVLNMWDVARVRGVTVDVELLERRLGVPVVPTEAHRRQGLDALREAIVLAADSSPPAPPEIFPEQFTDEVQRVKVELGNGDVPRYLVERMLLDVGGQVETEFAAADPGISERLRDVRARLADSGCRVPAVEAKARYAWVREVTAGALIRPIESRTTISDRIDAALTHRLFGLAFFAALMFVVFQAIYQWAGPFMEGIETAQEYLGGLVQQVIAPGALRSLIVDGVIGGVGAVIVFLPQIVLLFLFIAVLEDCGYMARAAFLMDKLMTKVGLSGKSFLPLMSSFACAVPGVMATRVIEDRRDRMVTILVAPLMSCSARLPVYVLLIYAFIPAMTWTWLGGWIGIGLQGVVLFGMTALGLLVAIPVAWLLKKTWFKGETPPFVMELPSYKWPSPRIVAARVYDRGMAFVTRAGSLIFLATIVIWGLGYFPGDHSDLHAVTAKIERLEAQPEGAAEDSAPRLDALYETQNRLSGMLVEESVLGRIGHVIEPVVKPLGWDWRIGVGAVASFPAREVIIATLGTIYSLGGEVDETDQGLRDELKRATWPDGRPVYTIPVALSIMVFFALCAQCAATLMVIKRETNSWRWPVFTFVYMTLLAYLGALATYQIGTAIATQSF